MRSLLEGITSTLRLAQKQQSQTLQSRKQGALTEAEYDATMKNRQDDVALLEAVEPLSRTAVASRSQSSCRFTTEAPADLPFRMLLITQNIGAIGPEVPKQAEGGLPALGDELSDAVRLQVRDFVSELRMVVYDCSRCEYDTYLRASRASTEEMMQVISETTGIELVPPLVDVVVIHFQEVGGKRLHKGFNAYFEKALESLLPEAGWTSGLLMESSNEVGRFTAIGSIVYLSHRMCPISSMLSFRHRTFVCVTDDPATYGGSPTYLYHAGKFSNAGESRKGYLLISLRLGTVVVNYLNLHLFNDGAGSDGSPGAPFSCAKLRQEAILEALAECAAFICTGDPLFILVILILA
ncbi:hypothetical protein TRVL_03682 [Trypanosoma vivax]|nr:hypothetical protein TRVL_03682 [Trypanosoma vivax]